MYCDRPIYRRSFEQTKQFKQTDKPYPRLKDANTLVETHALDNLDMSRLSTPIILMHTILLLNLFAFFGAAVDSTIPNGVFIPKMGLLS